MDQWPIDNDERLTLRGMSRSTKRIEIQRVRRNEIETAVDELAVEEPLQIRLGYARDRERHRRDLAVTMRTPGDDVELARGFLFSEGIIHGRDDISSIDASDDRSEDNGRNVVTVHLRSEVRFDPIALNRNFYTTSSCGVCGKESIAALAFSVARPQSTGAVAPDVIQRLPEILAHRQSLFQATGGIHAAALFDPNGTLIDVREDVGRHNAVDKLVGALLQQDAIPAHDSILLVSGRASFELVQKALMAGIPVMAAVGAPSSLAVQLAEEYGMTLIGFLRGDRFNTYCGAERIEDAA